MTYQDYHCPTCGEPPVHVITNGASQTVLHKIECSNPACPNPLSTGSYVNEYKAYDVWVKEVKNAGKESV